MTTHSKRIRFAPLPDPRRSVILTDDGKEHPLPVEYEVDEYDEKAAAASVIPIPIPLACIPESFSLAIIGVQSAPPTPVVTVSPLPPPSASAYSSQKKSSRRSLTSLFKSLAHHSSSSTSPTSSPDSSPNPGYDTLSSASSSSSSIHTLTPTQSNEPTTIVATPTTTTTQTQGQQSPAFYKPTSTNLPLNFGSGLFRPSSREPPTSRCRSSSSSKSGGKRPQSMDGSGLSNALSRWTSGSSSKSERFVPPSKGYGFGTPLYRTQSTQSYKKSKRLAEQARASGLLSSLHGGDNNNTRTGTKMLNGRVYGAKRNSKGLPSQTNHFANIKSDDDREEPEFVEWGYGGMGSVKHQKDGVGGKVWGRLAAGGDDNEGEDDGGGMAWVKRRKEQREREAREKAEKEAKEEGGGGESTPTPTPETTQERPTHTKSPSASNPSTPTQAQAQAQSPPPSTQQMARTDSQEEHVRAVNVPAPRPHHHHSHSRKSSLQVQITPPDMGAVEAVGGAEESAPAPVTKDKEEPVVATPPSESSSSSGSDEEDYSDRDEEDEDDDEEDEEEQEELRKTCMGAGVEKVSAHHHR
ncbi:hypothetical protein PQX77_017409 [Marasmius sp. AFHP31]|nr:hypothetical protein PQX77_017409 [Marasmius sp. AFHP31]